MELRDAGEVELVGLIQEQHPERCRLFLQWQGMDFPILVDALNRLGVAKVPMLWALDEAGVVRGVRPEFEWFAGEFLTTDYEAAILEEPAPSMAPAEDDAIAIEAYLGGDFATAIQEWTERASGRDDGRAWFRLGCAYRSRYDSDQRQDGDFQNAVAAWTQALSCHPQNYIWMRRLQQYGPTLQKPYPFYDWVTTARAELRARGEEPRALRVEPEGAERAGPSPTFPVEPDLPEPDPEGKLEHDADLVRCHAVVAPFPVAPGASARLSLRFLPSAEHAAHWTHDAGPLTVVVRPPDGWQVSRRVQASAPRADVATSAEERALDFEVLVPGDATAGDHELAGYAVYFVCEGLEGECVVRRQDFSVTVAVGAPAPR